MEEDDDPPVDDDFELDLEAVDVVSFAFAVVSLGVNALVTDSISGGNGSGNAWCGVGVPFFILRPFLLEGAYAVS